MAALLALGLEKNTSARCSFLQYYFPTLDCNRFRLRPLFIFLEVTLVVTVLLNIIAHLLNREKSSAST